MTLKDIFTIKALIINLNFDAHNLLKTSFGESILKIQVRCSQLVTLAKIQLDDWMIFREIDAEIFSHYILGFSISQEGKFYANLKVYLSDSIENEFRV